MGYDRRVHGRRHSRTSLEQESLYGNCSHAAKPTPDGLNPECVNVPFPEVPEYMVSSVKLGPRPIQFAPLPAHNGESPVVCGPCSWQTNEVTADPEHGRGCPRATLVGRIVPASPTEICKRAARNRVRLSRAPASVSVAKAPAIVVRCCGLHGQQSTDLHCNFDSDRSACAPRNQLAPLPVAVAVNPARPAGRSPQIALLTCTSIHLRFFLQPRQSDRGASGPFAQPAYPAEMVLPRFVGGEAKALARSASIPPTGSAHATRIERF